MATPIPPRTTTASTLPCGRPLPRELQRSANPQEILKEITERLAAFVAANRLKKSDVRQKILETIVYEARHFKVQELMDRLRKRHPEIGQATLYRNLPILVESGILQEGPPDQDGQLYYELMEFGHHDHIVCLDCRKVFEFQDSAIEDRQDLVVKKLRFRPRSHQHVIYAACEYLIKK